ncbi:three component ABC system middle component [Pseudoalteromonas sp. MMG012]|uniref:three component ABC system middle component n=1 Tax=Pseudoalteromonas sp. MMG012 TaxID=2822686 RepID=UPI001B39E60C|nr:three component ABC system middle component [Pseudoalteromonas sp. MMG012]MBQ4851044.1 hypothetical protein [Pseudoalteromonas sp. MMG012]
MSSVVDALYELKYNPFEYGPYFVSFYRALDEAENNLLLAPLLIPLCSHPIYEKKISNSNVRSSIWSVFDDRSKLYDLQERIDAFQKLTEQCIQYCLVNDWIVVNQESLSLSISGSESKEIAFPKVAEKLGRLFKEHSVVEIYAFLGVKPQ